MENLVITSADLVQQTLYDSIVAGWVNGAAHAIDGLPNGHHLKPKKRIKGPKSRVRAYLAGAAEINPPVPSPQPPAPPQVPPPPIGESAPGDEPFITFPAIERAYQSLVERSIVSPEEFRTLTASARQQAFTVTADLTADSIAKLRDNLADTLEAGPSLDDFRTRVLETFEKLPIGESHLENVYRSSVQEAFSQGMEHVLDHPLVGTAFPYRGYTAIHDARCRAEHRELETLGLDGTNVYHADDPTWKKFRPPWDYNCRCGWLALDIDTAAGLGVTHAKRWLRAIAAAEKAGTYNGLPETVMPPRVWVKPPPFNPPPGWQR